MRGRVTNSDMLKPQVFDLVHMQGKVNSIVYSVCPLKLELVVKYPSLFHQIFIFAMIYFIISIIWLAF